MMKTTWRSFRRTSIAATLVIVSSTYLGLCCSLAYAQSKPEGALSGRVLLEDGQPAVGARVEISSVGLRHGDEQTVQCDEAGSFKLNGLAPGSYSITATAPGYVTADDLSTRIYRLGETATIRLVKGGVITGRITDSSGEPLIDVSVKVQRLRDLNGKKVSQGEDSTRSGRHQTDDRGIYRAFGLYPGVYIVAVESSCAQNWFWSQGDNEVPTYYPMTTRDAALEITVRPGDEVSGIDIRHRGDTGHAISGMISGVTESSQTYGSPSLTLLNAATKEVVSSTSANQSKVFVFFGIPNGEYELYARMLGDNEINAAGSAPQRVSVKGLDVTGLNLRLTTYGSISGRVLTEPIKAGETKCESKTPPSIEEILLNVQSDRRNARSLNTILADADEANDQAAPNEKGEFTLPNLEPDGYRIEADLPNENWFVRSVTLPASGAAKTKTDAARSPINLKSGEKISGLEITLAEGAAALSGRIVPAKEGGNLTARLRVFMIPAEATAADDLLRYRETVIEKSATFEFKHLAPGKYRLLARSIPDTEKDAPRPAAFDSTERIKLRKEAEAANNEIELNSCQRVKDHVLKF